MDTLILTFVMLLEQRVMSNDVMLSLPKEKVKMFYFGTKTNGSHNMAASVANVAWNL